MAARICLREHSSTTTCNCNSMGFDWIRVLVLLVGICAWHAQACIVCNASTVVLAGVVDNSIGSGETWDSAYFNGNFRTAVVNPAFFGPQGLASPRTVSLQSFNFAGNTPISALNQSDILLLGLVTSSYFSTAQKAALLNWFYNGGSVISFSDVSIYNPFGDVLGIPVTSASCGGSCSFNSVPTDLRYGKSGPFGDVTSFDARYSVGIVDECTIVNRGGFVTSRDPSSRVTSAYFKPGAYKDAQQNSYPNSGAFFFGMDVDLYESRTYQPLSSLEAPPKFFLNTMHVMMRDIFNENTVMPGCWPDSHIGFVSVASSPHALDSCVGTSANVLRYVRVLRDSPSQPSIGGLNIQVVTRSENNPAATMTQSMTASCSRTGGCDLAMKWTSNVCSAGQVTVTIAFANGATTFTQSCTGDAACASMLAPLSSFTAVQSIRVDTSTPGGTCYGCSVALRLTSPEHPCFLASTVLASNLTANASAISGPATADVMLRFSTPVTVGSPAEAVRSYVPVSFGNATYNATYLSGNGTLALTYRANFGSQPYAGQYSVLIEPGNLYQALQTVRSVSSKLSAVPQSTLTPIVLCTTCSFDCSVSNTCAAQPAVAPFVPPLPGNAPAPAPAPSPAGPASSSASTSGVSSGAIAAAVIVPLLLVGAIGSFLLLAFLTPNPVVIGVSIVSGSGAAPSFMPMFNGSLSKLQLKRLFDKFNQNVKDDAALSKSPELNLEIQALSVDSAGQQQPYTGMFHPEFVAQVHNFFTCQSTAPSNPSPSSAPVSVGLRTPHPADELVRRLAQAAKTQFVDDDTCTFWPLGGRPKLQDEEDEQKGKSDSSSAMVPRDELQQASGAPVTSTKGADEVPNSSTLPDVSPTVVEQSVQLEVPANAQQLEFVVVDQAPSAM